jgi:hypothetical protein
MKLKLLSMSLLLAGAFAAAQPVLAASTAAAAPQATSQSIPDPALQVREVVRSLRANDLAGLVRTMVPPSKFQEMRQAYEIKRGEPISAEERAEFEEKLARFTAPDAVNTLMAEIEPKLVEARPQVAGATMMGIGAAQMAIASPESDLTPEQRATLQAALPGIQRWVTTTDFLSSESMRQALTLVTDAARATGIGNLDQLKMLSFEEVLAKAGNMLAASKQALRIYGLDLDAIAASAQFETLAIEGDTARVRTTVTVFDAPVSGVFELVLIEGRWYGKHALEEIRIDSDEQSES